MGLGSGVAAAAQAHLNLIIFGLSNHRLVFALVPMVALAGIFKSTKIERIGEDSIDGTAGQGLAAHFSRQPGAEPPFFVGGLQDAARGIEPRQHQVPHATDEWKEFGVFDQIVFSCCLNGIV